MRRATHRWGKEKQITKPGFLGKQIIRKKNDQNYSPSSFLLLLIFFPSTTTAIVFIRSLCDESGGEYTSNSTFQSNLHHLLNSLSLTSTSSTFNTTTQGSSPDLIYGLFLCRGDLDPTDCHVCVQNATQDILIKCPLSKQAILWYDYCELRYDYLHLFYSVYDTGNQVLVTGYNASDPEVFLELEKELLDRVTYYAAYNSSMMFATATAYNTVRKEKIYGLAQCTRDLSKDTCMSCLNQTRRDYAGFAPETMTGARVLGKSCTFRYESYTFYQGPPTLSITLPTLSPVPSPLPSPVQSTSAGGEKSGDKKGSKNTVLKVIGIVIPIVGGLVILIAVFIIIIRRRRRRRLARNDYILEEISSIESIFFDLSVLRVATDNFSDSRKLGQGGFGTVYKGTLPNGEDVAVKRLSASSRQGIEELKNELLLVAKLRHKNLVRLRGVCLEEQEKLLIYEFMPNRSLDSILFVPSKCKELNWERRFNIIQGITRGLVYLHEETNLKVIHRDLKASNILLDATMNPKISDFGLARLFQEDATQGITSRVVGTYGYMAPEYARRGQFSVKLDIYSFGILVLEILTSKKNSSFEYDSECAQDILSYTWENWKNGKALEIMDPSLGGKFTRSEALRCIQIALLCTQDAPAERPPMSSISLMLQSHSVPLQEPQQPRFIGGISMADSSMKSKQSDSSSNYVDDFSSASFPQEGCLGTKSNPSHRKEEEQKLVQVFNVYHTA